MGPGLLGFLLLALLLWSGVRFDTATATTADVPLWQDSAARTAPVTAAPVSYRSLTLNRALLDNLLATTTQLSLPLPDGSFTDFHLIESPIFEPAFRQKHPHYRSYRLVSVDDPFVHGRLVKMPSGLHALIEHDGQSDHTRSSDIRSR